jgi:hypothetical protein
MDEISKITRSSLTTTTATATATTTTATARITAAATTTTYSEIEATSVIYNVIILAKADTATLFLTLAT